MTTTNLHFQIFIVPNSAWTLQEGYDWERWAEKCPNVTGAEKMVQLWWFNPTDSKGVDNSVCHRGDGHGIISEYVPASWLEGLNEGESRTLTFRGGDVKVTANQSSYRYRRFGNFEEVLSQVLA